MPRGAVTPRPDPIPFGRGGLSLTPILGGTTLHLLPKKHLGYLIRRYMGRFAGSGLVYFQYLDDNLLPGRNRALLRVVTRSLCEFLQAQSVDKHKKPDGTVVTSHLDW